MKFKVIAVALVLLFILPSVGAVVYHYGFQDRDVVYEEEKGEQEEDDEEQEDDGEQGEDDDMATTTYNFTYGGSNGVKVGSTFTYDSTPFTSGIPDDLYVWSYTDVPSWATFTMVWNGFSKYYYHLVVNNPTTQGTFVLKAHGVPTGGISSWDEIQVNLTIKIIDCLTPGTYVGDDNLEYVLDNNGNLTVSKTGSYTQVTAITSAGLKLKTAEPTTGIQVIPFNRNDGTTYIQKVIIGNGITGVWQGQMPSWSGTEEASNSPTYEVVVGDGVEHFSYNFCAGSAVSRLYLGKDVNVANNYTSASEMYSICTGAVKLTEIEVHSDNPYFKSVDGVLFSKDGKVLLGYPLGNSRTHYEIPEGTETMAENMFYPSAYSGTSGLPYMQSIPLKSVTFPTTFIMISAGAFRTAFNINELIFKSNEPVSFGYLKFGPNYSVYGQNVTMDVRYDYSMVNDDPSTINVPSSIFDGCGGYYYVVESPDDVKVYSHNNWADSEGYFSKASGTTYAKLGQKLDKFNYYNLYYIDFNTDGSLDRNYQKSSGVTTLPDRTKQHYDFNGWYNAQSGGSKIGDYGDTFTFNTDTVLYARFTGVYYYLTYNITQNGTTPASIQRSQVQYPNKVRLPSVSKQHYTFDGWADSGGSVAQYQPDSEYGPLTGDTTIDTIWTAMTYTTTFKDADGSVISTIPAQYPNSISIPTNNHSTTAFNFVGWFMQGSVSDTPDLGNTDTTYQPLKNETYVRKYTYSRSLKSPYRDNKVQGQDGYWAETTISGTIYPGLSNVHQLPKLADANKPTKRGFRISGWSAVDEGEPSITTNPSVQYTTEYSPVLNSNDPSVTKDDVRFASSTDIYSVWKPAELESISLVSNLLITKKPDESQVQAELSTTGSPPKVVVTPDDWLGTLDWDTDDESGSYLTVSSSGRLSAIVTGVNDTGTNVVNVYATGKKRTWEGSSVANTITSNNCIVNISEYLQVLFYTRNNDGIEEQYKEVVGNTTQDAWYVYHNSALGTYTWQSPYSGLNAYPQHDPSRNDYEFIGWLNTVENTPVDSSNPPKMTTTCVASWMGEYLEKDNDVLILQKFNKEGNRIISQIDMGLISSLREVFSTSVSETPTPTMTSENTFITDLSCTETIPIQIIRTNPKVIDDNADDSLHWSNAKWITEVRGLVDRWQSDTDGIKVLFLPRGLRKITVNGNDVCIGDNYDMLGYVKPKTYVEDGQTKSNVGLLFGNDYVLVGYNAIITEYNDTYVAGTVGALAVNMTFTLGGMRSEYQEWAEGLILK